MSNQAEIAERLDRVGNILDNLLCPLAERTAGLADILTNEISGQGSLIHLAFQIEVNAKGIHELLGEALKAGWPKPE